LNESLIQNYNFKAMGLYYQVLSWFIMLDKVALSRLLH